jgi:hypothetical protein
MVSIPVLRHEDNVQVVPIPTAERLARSGQVHLGKTNRLAVKLVHLPGKPAGVADTTLTPGSVPCQLDWQGPKFSQLDTSVVPLGSPASLTGGKPSLGG